MEFLECGLCIRHNTGGLTRIVGQSLQDGLRQLQGILVHLHEGLYGCFLQVWVAVIEVSDLRVPACRSTSASTMRGNFLFKDLSRRDNRVTPLADLTASAR
jgi:hypothetical protein